MDLKRPETKIETKLKQKIIFYIRNAINFFQNSYKIYRFFTNDLSSTPVIFVIGDDCVLFNKFMAFLTGKIIIKVDPTLIHQKEIFLFIRRNLPTLSGTFYNLLNHLYNLPYYSECFVSKFQIEKYIDESNLFIFYFFIKSELEKLGLRYLDTSYIIQN